MYEKNLKVSYLLDFYGALLTDKQRDAVDLYYNEDLSLAEIAEHTQITRQGVRDAIKRGEELLFMLEEKLGFARKSGEFQDAMELIGECATEIKFAKTNMNYYKILDENVDKIITEVKKFL